MSRAYYLSMALLVLTGMSASASAANLDQGIDAPGFVEPTLADNPNTPISDLNGGGITSIMPNEGGTAIGGLREGGIGGLTTQRERGFSGLATETHTRLNIGASTGGTIPGAARIDLPREPSGARGSLPRGGFIQDGAQLGRVGGAIGHSIAVSLATERR